MKTNLKNFPITDNINVIIWMSDFEAELREMRDKTANISKMIVYTEILGE